MDHNVRNIYLLYLGLRAKIEELPQYDKLEEETLWYKGYVIELNYLHDFLERIRK